MKCIGSLCPPSLEAINTPKFVIRAGIIPYILPSFESQGKILLGIKQGKYTDFGGGCKGSKMEKPFDCALREMREEAGHELDISLDGISHLFISGKTKPHQVVLFVQTDELWEPKIPRGELDGVELMTFIQFIRLDRRLLTDSLKSIYDNIRTIVMEI